MREPLNHCPGCQSIYSPGTPICATCGRVLAAVLETIPIGTSPALETIPIGAPAARPQPPPRRLFAPLLPGQPLAGGRYTILRPLSRGGMGALYLATDREAFDRTVVIKGLLDDAVGGTPEEAQAARARFEREARTLAALAYPTIPQIFSYFREGAQNYIVMAYIEGRDLSQGLTHVDSGTQQVVGGRAYPLANVLRWGVALCRTLEYLSSKTPPVVHQDIKPANLILNRHSEELFLVDFGAARARAHLSAAGHGQTAVFGTPGYAAPEQYQGLGNQRSDVYALAATLYHLATDDDPGAHPFSFPRLGYLGYLGPILRAALKPEWNERPTATALREQIEAVLAPESGRVLYSPDQVALTNEQELAAWCEQHWAAAAEWLYHGLPDHVQISWVKLALAGNLRRCVQQHLSDPNAGLDAAIALLDRSGFGAAAAALVAEPQTLELERFTSLANEQYANGQLVIRNGGRRYVHAAIALPPWMSTPAPDVALIGGQETTLALRADQYKMPILPRNTAVVVRWGDRAGLSVPIRGKIPSQRQADPPPLLFLIILAIVLMAMCVLGGLLPTLQAISGGR
jgi:serine/threonine protein kinase